MKKIINYISFTLCVVVLSAILFSCNIISVNKEYEKYEKALKEISIEKSDIKSIDYDYIN